MTGSSESDYTPDYESKATLEFDPGSYTVLYVIITLTVGMCAREINKRTGIPYTPMLLVIGGFLGAVPHFGYISYSTEFAMQIDPHAILIILLPILIFESSYNAHIEVLAKNFWQVMLLVVPGVMMSAFILGTVIYFVLDYTDIMSFTSSLVLGSILATTDPVAVVALLKSLGAPVHIETLIEMESLFNDGVAMVFFEVFIKLAQGDKFNFGHIVGEFCLMAFGGPAVGFAFSIVALIVLNIFTRGTTLFISILVLLSYSVFLFTEKFLEGKVSGILAILICGISMNLWAKDYMTNTQKSAVAILLGYLQHISETILFFLSGIFVGDNLFNDNTGKSDFSSEDEIQGSDWWKTFVLYIFLQLTRIFMFLIFMWPLKKTGEGMTWKEAYVAMWGGLRGALAIALALIVYADESHEDGITRRQQNLILFHTCAVSALTLLLNGTTCGAFVEWLGIIENVNIKQKFKQNYLKEVKQEAIRQKVLLKNTNYFDQVEWKGVDELVNLKDLEKKQGWADLTSNWIGHKKSKQEKKQVNKLVNQLRHINNDMQPSVINNMQNYNPLSQAVYSSSNNKDIDGSKQTKTSKNSRILSKYDRFQVEKYMMIRYEFLRIFMKCLAFSKSKEWISNRVFTLIYNSAEECTEKLGEPISMWHHLEESLASKTYQRFLKAGTKFCIFRIVFDYFLHSEIEFIHEMVYIYVSTINDAKIYIKQLQGQTQTNKKIQDWNLILQEVDEDYKKAKDYLQYVKKHNFELLGKLEQRKAAIKIIMAQAKMVDEHIRNKFIPEKEGNEIKEYLSGKLAVLYSIRTLVKLTSISQDMIKVYFKETLDENEIDYLLTNRKEMEFEDGELILDLDMVADYVYYIQTGEIEVTITTEGTNQNTSMTFIQGQVVGLTNLVDSMDQSLIRMVAKDETNCILLPISELREFYFNNDKFESFCLKKCFYQFLHLFSKTSEEKDDAQNEKLWCEWEVKNPDEIHQIANESTVVRLDENEKIFLEFGGYLYSGQLTSQEINKCYFEYELLPSETMYSAEELCTLLQFNKPYIKLAVRGQVNDNNLNVNHYKKGDAMNDSYQKRLNYANQSRKISTLNAIEYMSQDNQENNRQKYIDQLNWIKKHQITKPMHSNKQKLGDNENNLDDAAIVKNPGNQGDQDDMEDLDSIQASNRKIRQKKQTRPSQQTYQEDFDSQIENALNHQPSSRKYSQQSLDRGLMGRRGSFEANRIKIMEKRNKELRENQQNQKVNVVYKQNKDKDVINEENFNDQDESSGTQNIQELKKDQSSPDNPTRKFPSKNENFGIKNIKSNNNANKNQNQNNDVHNIYEPSSNDRSLNNNIINERNGKTNINQQEKVKQDIIKQELNKLDDRNLNHADINVMINDQKIRNEVDPEDTPDL